MDLDTYQLAFLIQIEGQTLWADITGEITSFVFEDNEEELDLMELSVTNRHLRFVDDQLFQEGNEIVARFGYVNDLSPCRKAAHSAATLVWSLAERSHDRLGVEFATLERVHWFNHRRILEAIGNRPPAEAEAAYHRQREHTALAACLKRNTLRETRRGSVADYIRMVESRTSGPERGAPGGRRFYSINSTHTPRTASYSNPIAVLANTHMLSSRSSRPVSSVRTRSIGPHTARHVCPAASP